MNTRPWYSPISGRANTISSTSGGKTFSPLIFTMSSQRPIVPDSIMSSCRPQLHCCHGRYTARSRVRKRISGDASFSRCVTTISPTSPGADRLQRVRIDDLDDRRPLVHVHAVAAAVA